jgi:hypothetical protein
MIIVFNPTISQTINPSAYNISAAAEYAISQLDSTYNFNKLFRDDLNFRYYIKSQFPQWLVDQANKNSDVKIIDLIQEFYNFYFSKNGLNLYPNYEHIQNIFFMNLDGLKETYKSLFADFDFDDFIENKEQELREFLIANKKRFIVNKGKKEAYEYFLQTFFPDVYTDFKIGIDETFVLNSASLNEQTLTDGTNYQEFSIVIESSIDEKYEDDFISMLKPVGFYMNLKESPQTFVSMLSYVSKKNPLAVTISGT